ncbi:YceI family protein [Actinokineospora xionganensis]|uniref:YceI family protein n=1 Tax=Actinokineospora xionganensis TaxID=2684470 RepID=A0ABR7LGD9_9PSEU|nr:YceI family protein [Actinokineospora xionganensis]MBC6451444.1 YceI family protein [Actinokineospora xionganensis]
MTAGVTPVAIELPESARYRLAPTRCSARFTVAKLGLFRVSGEFTVTSGTVSVADGVASVHAELDAASFRTAMSQRDKDIKSPKFLDVAVFPTLVYDGELVGDRIEGTLRVRDRAVPTDLALTAVHFGTDGVDVTATARLDRFEAGLTRAKGIVGQFVDIALTVTLVRSEGERS